MSLNLYIDKESNGFRKHCIQCFIVVVVVSKYMFGKIKQNL